MITAFTVDSSTMPQELQASRLVVFDVDAMDDVGIDRIEIYDSDTLLATVTEIPYRTEILLSSADNGSHSYSAVAIDTAGRAAWAGRFDELGNPIWFHVYQFDSDRGTGLTTNTKDKLFAVGWESLLQQDLLGWHGTGWVAELSL